MEGRWSVVVGLVLGWGAACGGRADPLSVDFSGAGATATGGSGRAGVAGWAGPATSSRGGGPGSDGSAWTEFGGSPDASLGVAGLAGAGSRWLDSSAAADVGTAGRSGVGGAPGSGGSESASTAADGSADLGVGGAPGSGGSESASTAADGSADAGVADAPDSGGSESASAEPGGSADAEDAGLRPLLAGRSFTAWANRTWSNYYALMTDGGYWAEPRREGLYTFSDDAMQVETSAGTTYVALDNDWCYGIGSSAAFCLFQTDSFIEIHWPCSSFPKPGAGYLITSCTYGYLEPYADAGPDGGAADSDSD